MSACPVCGSLSPEKRAKPCRDKPAGAYRSVDDPELYRCPAWADGQHCYEVGMYVTTGEQAKRCACGKTVERT